MSQLGPPAAGALIAALKNSDPRTQQSILVILGRIADALFRIDADAAVEPLLQWLERRNFAPRAEGYVAQELGRRRLARAAAVLKTKLLDIPSNPAYGTSLSFYRDLDWTLKDMRSWAFPAYALPLAYARCAGPEAVDLLIVLMPTYGHTTSRMPLRAHYKRSGGTGMIPGSPRKENARHGSE